MDTISLVKLIIDTGIGGMSLALFFRLGRVVANHEVRISVLEDRKNAVRTRRKRPSRAR